MGDTPSRGLHSGRMVLFGIALLAVAVPVASRWSALASGETYDARLSAAQQVPPVWQSAGLGTGVFVVRSDRSMEGRVVTSGIDATIAHLHEGAVGRLGPVIVPLARQGDTFVVPPDTRLTEGQMATLRAGEVYVSVCSERYPDGELRAQLMPPPGQH